MLDPLRVWEPEIRALLPTGESPLAAATCQLAFGADHLERSPDEIAHLLRFLPQGLRDEYLTASRSGPVTRSRWEKILERGIDMVTGSAVDADFEKLIGGISASGHVGSVAHRLSSVLSARFNFCLVSDRRLVFVERKVEKPFVELASVPRQALLRARRAGKLLQHGRVMVDFIDLSQLALMTGMLFTGAANRLVAALGGGVVREGD